MFELIGSNGAPFAVPYRDKKALKPICLPSGLIVEKPTAEHRKHLPRGLRANLPVTGDGKPLSDAQLDKMSFTDEARDIYFVGLTDTFVLPDGRVAAVYGCSAREIPVPLGGDEDLHDKIMRIAIEKAEMGYVRALEQGIEDPVIELNRTDKANPTRVEICIWVRSKLADAIADKCSEAADLLQADRDPETPVTIVVTTWKGVSVINRALP